MKRLAVLLSGRGSNLVAIADRAASGELPAIVAVAVSDVASAAGLEAAAARGIPRLVVPSQGVARDTYAEQLLKALAPYQVDLVCLAGFMRLLGKPFIRAYEGRILNIHPSLLPAFPGLHAPRQALEYGVKISGCTVHFVDEGLDSGPIVMQAAVPVLPDDTEETLSQRILEQEHIIYSQAIARVLAGPVAKRGRRTLI